MDSEGTSIKAFTAALASSSPVPGGGGASALAGALAAALCSMAANLTVGKPRYASVEDDMIRIAGRCSELSAELTGLIDKDAEAFIPLAGAYSISKADPEREKAIAEASINACSAVCMVLTCCCEVTELLEDALEKCSPMMISDVGCGALLCNAALKAAAMNVFVNTKALRGTPRADMIEKRVYMMLNEYGPRTEKISSAVMQQLTGGANG